ncbi:uncharacterized protein DNG_05792 [Cephalotrichum gorgonifer]|uniref:DUF4604 domain-containing protein n=1 Tax=Cephalotrichum gorgonifer TaxID=2041049 RepID=A0AAE8MYU7_9PEZI|nr:uncharacterized protein DNG_05792 [Cephalotrichum gorgonifer]
MSQKFNAKNLSYDDRLPPFLARLKSQNATTSSSPNPLLGANRRHGAKRSGSAEAEDAPLVVDAGGNVVAATVDGDGTVRYEDGGEAEGERGGVEDGGGEKGAEVKAAVAIGRKRKARVIGAGQEDEQEGEKGGDGDARKGTAVKDKAVGDAADSKPAPKAKKKAKKIKLSFDDDGP